MIGLLLGSLIGFTQNALTASPIDISNLASTSTPADPLANISNLASTNIPADPLANIPNRPSTIPSTGIRTNPSTNAPTAPPNLAAILEPVDAPAYQRWLPEAKLPAYTSYKPESDSLVGFRIRIIDKNAGNKDVTSKYPFQASFRLTQVTHYKGICSNFPMVAVANEEPDLQWDLGMLKQYSRQFSRITADTMTTLPDSGSIAVARVSAHDFGAYGKISAEVTFAADAQTLQAETPLFPNQFALTIPIDRNGNKIGDQWEFKEQILSQNKPSDDDTDKLPDNGNPGDDLLLLDEYRGFIIEHDQKKTYLRFSPQQKELVVAGEDEHLQDIGHGALNFGKITGLQLYTIHCFTDLDLRNPEPNQKSRFDRWINCNSPTNHKSYCVVVSANQIMDAQAAATTRQLKKADAGNDKLPKVDGDNDKLQQMDAGNDKLPSVNDANGAYYPREIDHIHLSLPHILETDILQKAAWYKDIRTADPKHHAAIDNANRLYGYHIDSKALRKTILDNQNLLLSRLIQSTVTQQLGHATKIPHHNATVSPAVDPLAYYKNDIHCPMRLWYTDGINENGLDWMLSFLSMAWNPTTILLPDKKPLKLCIEKDACWHKMALRPPLNE